MVTFMFIFGLMFFILGVVCVVVAWRLLGFCDELLAEAVQHLEDAKDLAEEAGLPV